MNDSGHELEPQPHPADDARRRADAASISDDERTLAAMGYSQQLARRMHGFSNFAMSLSIICILAGGVTSFHLGFCGVGGAAIGIGWPLVCMFSLLVAMTMAEVASAFPTAGGLYHWATILGGRGWGWTTAWFNLVGLVTVLAAVNVGAVQFFVSAFRGGEPLAPLEQTAAVLAITASQAIINHLGIRLTSALTDLSGYWILLVSSALAASLLIYATGFDFSRLVTFSNHSGLPAASPVWPTTGSVGWLFALGFLLPAYTITGFDASAHAAEETIAASYHVPRGIVRSVLVSGLFGWAMLAAVVLAMPDVDQAAEQGERAFLWTLTSVLPARGASLLGAGIFVAQYLCGLATVTSASRMMYAFARDRGLPGSRTLASVSPRFKTPVAAIWTVAIAAVLFTLYTPVYSTISVVCTIFLYISYVVPTALGFFAYGRSWKRRGPWHLGVWYRPAALASSLGCAGLIVIGVQPPNELALYVVLAAIVGLSLLWWIRARHVFPGPPSAILRFAHEDQPHD